MQALDRITRDPAVMGGKACIRGMRVTVSMIVATIGIGRTIDELLSEYPYLERDDVLQALRYAAWRVDELVSRPSTGRRSVMLEQPTRPSWSGRRPTTMSS